MPGSQAASPPQLLRCLRCAHSLAWHHSFTRCSLSSSARRGKHSVEGQGLALLVPRSTLCPSTTLHNTVLSISTAMGPSQCTGEERNQPPSARETPTPNTGRMLNLEGQGKGLHSAPGKRALRPPQCPGTICHPRIGTGYTAHQL